MEIKSHNSSSNKFAWQFFVPSITEIILYALTSLVLLTVVNVSAIWDYLSGNPSGRQYAEELFGQGSGDGILGTSLQGRISQIVVWGLMGILIYTVVWFVKNILTNLRNDVIADEYIHPRSYSRKNYWKSIAIRKVFFVGILAVLAGYIYLCVKLFPIFSSYYLNAITNFSASSLINALAVIAGMAILLHILVALSRLAINSWQFIHADL